jgi:hypothetical protein
MDRPMDFHIDQRVLIYIGGDDELQTVPRDVMLKYFEDRVRDMATISLYPEGDHSLWECEQQVSDEIVKWVWS